MRWIQVPNALRPSNACKFRHARTNASCTQSSATSGLRVIRKHNPYTRALCPRYKRSNAFMSPRRAAATKRASDMDSRSMLTTESLPCTLDSKIRLDGSTALVRIGCGKEDASLNAWPGGGQDAEEWADASRRGGLTRGGRFASGGPTGGAERKVERDADASGWLARGGCFAAGGPGGGA